MKNREQGWGILLGDNEEGIRELYESMWEEIKPEEKVNEDEGSKVDIKIKKKNKSLSLGEKIENTRFDQLEHWAALLDIFRINVNYIISHLFATERLLKIQEFSHILDLFQKKFSDFCKQWGQAESIGNKMMEGQKEIERIKEGLIIIINITNTLDSLGQTSNNLLPCFNNLSPHESIVCKAIRVTLDIKVSLPEKYSKKHWEKVEEYISYILETFHSSDIKDLIVNIKRSADLFFEYSKMQDFVDEAKDEKKGFLLDLIDEISKCSLVLEERNIKDFKFLLKAHFQRILKIINRHMNISSQKAYQ